VRDVHQREHMLGAAVLLLVLLVLAGCGGGSSGPSGNGGTSTTPELLAMENEAFAAINSARTGNGLPALTFAADVRDVARAHSQDMATRGFFDHVNPDGKTPANRVSEAGISYSMVAENIAMNWNMPDPVQTAVQGWLASPGHYANIMNTTVTESGVGIARTQDGHYYLTQVFIKRQ